MNTVIKALFGLAVLNLLIYAFYAIAFVFILPRFGPFGIVAILVGLGSFLSARGFYRLIDVSGIERIKSIVIVHTVILVAISALTIFLTPLLKETVTNISQVSKYKKFRKGEAPIENGVWEYRKAGMLSSKNEFITVPCKDGQIDGQVIFNHFDDDGFKVDFYSKGQLDSTTFWQGGQMDTMYLTKTHIQTDTFFYHLDFDNIDKKVQKIGINEKGDTILNVMSPVISEVFDTNN